MSIFVLLSVLVACLGFVPAHAEPVEMSFTAASDGSQQSYVELLPPDFDPQKPHDLLIALHGHGSDRWQFARASRDECRGFRDVAAKHGCILLCPDYRAKTSWMGPSAESDVVQLIAEYRKKHKVGRVLVGGGSMGGTAALIFAALHPDLIFGVCALNGTANMVEYRGFPEAITASYGGGRQEALAEYRKRSPELWPGRFMMPVAVTTGGVDRVVPPDSVLRLADALAAAGGAVLKLHRPEGGHATNYADTCEALEFCIRESRKDGGEAALILAQLQRVQQRIALLPGGEQAAADAAAFTKAVEWALRYDSVLSSADAALLKRFLVRGEERLSALESGQIPWLAKRGKRVGGFVSAVDGSIQPYGLVVPASYDGTTPMRLDVVLHGSSRPVGLSEAKFMARFEEGDSGGGAPDVRYLELHPLGRVENGYRWAGETDVFEAVAAVSRVCRVDPERIVLRGMSMGASGTWHLGLKYPDRFVALAPYCGYVDTHRFSQTPLPNFIRVGPLPAYQEMGLHMLDSVDYAANAGVVPAVAAIGDKDVFWDSHVHMGEAFRSEGLEMLNLVSHGTGHVVDPATHREQMRRVEELARVGRNADPAQIRFVTWTLKYARCHWLEVLGLEQHYQRAEVRAGHDASDRLSIGQLSNITRFAVHRPVTQARIEGAEVPLPEGAGKKPGLVFVKGAAGWTCEGFRSDVTLSGKQPGLQGPLDDALTRPFVCIRGTGHPWNPGVHAWSMAALKRLEYEWPRYMRGDLPVRDDSAVSPADLEGKNVLLFGDPGSNALLAKILPDLPVRWTRNHLELGHERFDAPSHVPVFIAPSPLEKGRSVVVNGGHSFGEKEFASLNYLLFPRLGDCAVIRVGRLVPDSQRVMPEEGLTPLAAFQHRFERPASSPATEEVVRVGYFDEAWREARWVRP